jgi:hypothetical protein
VFIGRLTGSQTLVKLALYLNRAGTGTLSATLTFIHVHETGALFYFNLKITGLSL